MGLAINENLNKSNETVDSRLTWTGYDLVQKSYKYTGSSVLLFMIDMKIYFNLCKTLVNIFIKFYIIWVKTMCATCTSSLNLEHKHYFTFWYSSQISPPLDQIKLLIFCNWYMYMGTLNALYINISCNWARLP